MTWRRWYGERGRKRRERSQYVDDRGFCSLAWKELQSDLSSPSLPRPLGKAGDS